MKGKINNEKLTLQRTCSTNLVNAVIFQVSHINFSSIVIDADTEGRGQLDRAHGVDLAIRRDVAKHACAQLHQKDLPYAHKQ